jgi:hypothetical protein
VHAVLRALAEAGLPLLDLGPLQDEFYDQQAGGRPIGPEGRALGVWLRFAPEIFGTKSTGPRG